jgi:hypothetical protein
MSPLGCRGSGPNPHETPFRFQVLELVEARRHLFVSLVGDIVWSGKRHSRRLVGCSREATAGWPRQNGGRRSLPSGPGPTSLSILPGPPPPRTHHRFQGNQGVTPSKVSGTL